MIYDINFFTEGMGCQYKKSLTLVFGHSTLYFLSGGIGGTTNVSEPIFCIKIKANLKYNYTLILIVPTSTLEVFKFNVL